MRKVTSARAVTFWYTSTCEATGRKNGVLPKRPVVASSFCFMNQDLVGKNGAHHRGEPGNRAGHRRAVGAGRGKRGHRRQERRSRIPSCRGRSTRRRWWWRRPGGKALALKLDVRDEAAVAGVVAAAVERFGGLDAVVNNAGAIALTNVEGTRSRSGTT